VTARNGSAEWHGDLERGSGTVIVGEHVFEGPYSYQSRFGEAEEGTNPEQLVAAGLAGCFTMGVAALLSTAGHAPTALRTTARVQLRFLDGAPTLSHIDLDIEGQIPGVNEALFVACAEEAKKTCPVARALAGVPEITLTAKLVEPDPSSPARPGD
jgi:lipoyl-dependent peroxiredoxin